MCEQAVTPLEQLTDRGRILALEAGTVLGEARQRLFELADDALRPLLGIGLVGAFVGKRRIVRLRCEGDMHFPKPLAEQPVERLKFIEGAEMILVQRHATGDLVAYRAVEVVQRPFPGVALTVEEMLDHHQRHRLALLVDPADLAEHAGDVGETTGGEEPAHFQLDGYPPRRDAAA